MRDGDTKEGVRESKRARGKRTDRDRREHILMRGGESKRERERGGRVTDREGDQEKVEKKRERKKEKPRNRERAREKERERKGERNNDRETAGRAIADSRCEKRPPSECDGSPLSSPFPKKLKQASRSGAEDTLYWTTLGLLLVFHLRHGAVACIHKQTRCVGIDLRQGRSSI